MKFAFADFSTSLGGLALILEGSSRLIVQQIIAYFIRIVQIVKQA